MIGASETKKPSGSFSLVPMGNIGKSKRAAAVQHTETTKANEQPSKMEDLLDDDDFEKILGGLSEKPANFLKKTAADTHRRETEDDDFF